MNVAADQAHWPKEMNQRMPCVTGSAGLLGKLVDEFEMENATEVLTVYRFSNTFFPVSAEGSF
jgi:hypothetical protein